MAKVYLFGSRSGTEAIKGSHQTSLAVESNGNYYWFDCAEDSSLLALDMNVDITKIRTIMFSHMHIDHIGGFPNMIHNVVKNYQRNSIVPVGGVVDVFLADGRKWEAFKEIAGCANVEEVMKPHQLKDGVVFQDENVKITAFHTHHIETEETNNWTAFSFLVETQGKRFVFSGDVKGMFDLDNTISSGCDLIFVETGHHKIKDVCEYMNSKNVKHVVFMHHGREILEDFKGCEKYIKEHINCDVDVAVDKMVFDL